MVEDKNVIAFCNATLRPLMVHLGDVYFEAKRAIAEFEASGVQAALPNDTTVIGDNSQADGRPQITAGGVLLTMANLAGVIEQLETTQAGGVTLVQGVLGISPRHAGNR